MPRIAAAASSSRVRTPPRSPSATSDGSLTDPDSPSDPQMRMTRTPASARRASVPPHASDSSSGWARTTRTVLGASGTLRLHDAPVDVHVALDHALHSEARHRALADAPAIEIEHARQL